MKVSLNALFSFFIPINACFLEVWDDICKFYSLNLLLQVNRLSFLSEDHVTCSMKEVPMKKKSPNGPPQCYCLPYSWPSQKYQTTYLCLLPEN